jgi:cytochrome c oxidase assembly protein subunit 11
MSQIAPSNPDLNPTAQARRNARLAAICALVFALMVGASFASVPLYRAFCQLTGFGQTHLNSV